LKIYFKSTDFKIPEEEVPVVTEGDAPAEDAPKDGEEAKEGDNLESSQVQDDKPKEVTKRGSQMVEAEAKPKYVIPDVTAADTEMLQAKQS